MLDLLWNIKTAISIKNGQIRFTIIIIKMNIQSPYCITTNSGRLQLTKGAYLTLMKRKNSICKTLQKSKTITHSYKQNKKTIKKSYTNEWKDKTQSVNNCVKTCGNDKDNGGEMVQMVQRKNGQFVTRNFPVRYDREVFNFPPMIPNVPIIEMELDNDCESEWPEIEECVHNMTMSLSLAMFDRKASMKRKDLV